MSVSSVFLPLCSIYTEVKDRFPCRRIPGILQLLEKKGYIKRISVPTDARLKKIVITTKAQELRDQVVCETERSDQLLKKGLSKDEIDFYIRISDRICNNIT